MCTEVLVGARPRRQPCTLDDRPKPFADRCTDNRSACTRMRLGVGRRTRSAVHLPTLRWEKSLDAPAEHSRGRPEVVQNASDRYLRDFTNLAAPTPAEHPIATCHNTESALLSRWEGFHGSAASSPTKTSSPLQSSEMPLLPRDRNARTAAVMNTHRNWVAIGEAEFRAME